MTNTVTDDETPEEPPATYTAEEFAAKLGVSTWAIYEAARRGDCPVLPIRLGRRLVWSCTRVNRLLGLDPDPAQ